MDKRAGVIIRKAKVYIPTQALTDAGYYFEIEPVQVADLTLNDLTAALERAFEAGNPRIPTPTVYELDHVLPRKDPVLRAAGVSSWKKLAQGAGSYSIAWLADRVVLYISKLDKRGRFVGDPDKTRTFPHGIAAREIAKAILDDVASRPELQ